jgi:hypothetical protein
MADILRIKRRVTGSPGAPASLANAEIAYNEVDHVLYYGEGTGGAGGSATVVVPIAGGGMGSSALPAMDGTAAAGSAAQWSRADHIHPVDTSRYAASNPSGFQTAAQVLAVRLDQFQPPNIDVAWNSHKITGLADPTNPQDAASKNYVDAVAQGLDAKPSVRAATAGANITLSGPQTVDGVALIAGDRVLVKDQTATSANGIYVVASGAWARGTDVDVWAELVSAFTFVENGTANADSGWLCTVDPGGTLGTTAVTWVQFSGAGQINAGNGLTKTGNTIDAVGTANRIVVNPDSLDIAPTYVGQTSITTLGTVATGTWNAATVTVPYGGTGAVSLTGYVKGNGVAAFSASATIPSSDVTGLGTMSTQNANSVAITGGTIDGVTLDCGTF